MKHISSLTQTMCIFYIIYHNILLQYYTQSSKTDWNKKWKLILIFQKSLLQIPDNQDNGNLGIIKKELIRETDKI